MKRLSVALVALVVGCTGGGGSGPSKSTTAGIGSGSSSSPGATTAPSTSQTAPPGTLPVPPAPNHPIDFGYYYQDGRYGDFSPEVYPYTNLALASPTAYDSAATWGNANPTLDKKALLAKTLAEAHAAKKTLFLMPGPEADWDKTLDAATPYWSDIKYCQLYAEDTTTDRATAEATTGRFLANVAGRGLAKPLITALESPGPETASNTDVVEIEAYIPQPFNQDDPANVGRLTSIIDARKATVQPGKSIGIVMMAYDRNGLWTNVSTLQQLQFPAYLESINDTRVIALTMFSYARPGGTRDHPMLKYVHELMASAMFGFPVPVPPPGAVAPPSTTNRLVGSNFAVPGPAGCFQDAPDLAYDALDDVFLVASGYGPIMGGTFVDGTGNIVGQPFVISQPKNPGSYYGEFARVAFSPDAQTFLVAWYAADGTPTYNVHACTVKLQNGAPVLGAELSVSTTAAAANGGAAGAGAPVIYNPDAREFAVAWAQTNADANGPAGIHVQRVSATGALVGSAFTTSDGASEDWPALAYDGKSKEYVLTYAYWGQGVAARAQRFTATGAPDGGPITLATGQGGVWIPVAAYDPSQDRFLVVASIDGRTVGQMMSSALQPMGSAFTLSEGTHDGIALSYDPKAQGFFAILQGQTTGDDYAADVTGAGTAGSPFAWTNDQATNGNFHPRAAFDSKRGEWLAVTSKDLATLVGQRITSP
ncbi:MAG TPA: hypothetical protein VFF73_41275 [Planctomycetota bacterium]|nr:hypothetical protein [Planctomycetota bacterium]